MDTLVSVGTNGSPVTTVYKKTDMHRLVSTLGQPS